MNVSRQKALNLAAQHKPVTRLLYRNLLQQAKIFDQNPALKAIWKRPYELREKDDLNLFYIPNKSFVEEVRRRFREEVPLTTYDFNKAQDLGFDTIRAIIPTQKYYFDQLAQLKENPVEQKAEIENSQNKPHLIQTTTPPPIQPIKPIQSIQPKSTSPSQLEETQQESLLWAIPEPSPVIRPGLYLVAHPMTTGYFRNSIILICSHEKHGTTGLILNKKIHPILLRSLFSRLIQKGKSFDRKKFVPLIKQGGPLKQNWLSALHTNKDLKNSHALSNDLFLNINLKLMSSEFIKETSSPSNFRFFFGYCFWNPGQLEAEIKNGFWFPASASSDFVFTPPLKKKNQTFNTWRDMLRCLGGEYSAFMDIPEAFWKLHVKKLEHEEAEQNEEDYEIDQE